MKTLTKFIYLLMAFCCLSFTHVYADNVVEEKEKVDVQEEADDNRKRTRCPLEVWLDEGTISVTFLDMPAEATVTILNVQTGEVIHQIYVSPQMVYIPLIGNGDFTIEISFNNRTFVGEFTL